MRVFCCLLLLVAAVASVGAQEKNSTGLFTQTVEVRVVNVDVYATDKKGNPVTDLTEEDFLLLADGREVDIAYFYTTQGAASPEPREASPTAAGYSTIEPAPTEDLLVVLYIDNYWLTPFDRKRVMGDLEQFVEAQKASNFRFLVVTHNPGLQIETSVTRDVQQVLDVLAAVPDQPAKGLHQRRAKTLFYDEVRSIWDLYLDSRACSDPCQCGHEQMVGAWQQNALDTGRRISISHAGMTELLDALGGMPERKAVVYVGSGYDQRPGLDLLQYLSDVCPAYEREFATYMQRYDESMNLLDLSASANSSRVTFYPLDAGGLRADSAASVDLFDARLRPSGLVSQIERANLQASFQILASATGGRAILNANRPFDDLIDLEDDFRHVYSLGFAPEGIPDDKTHRLKVELREKRRGVNLRFRQSFVDKPLDRRLIDRAVAAMTFSEEVNPLNIAAQLGDVKEVAAKAFEIPVHVAIATERLTFIPNDQGHSAARFRVFLAARSAEGGRTTLREKFFDITGADAAEPVQRITVTMHLEPGDYTIGVGVRDEIGTETSYLALEASAEAVAPST